MLQCGPREGAFHAHYAVFQRPRILAPASGGSPRLTAKETMLRVAEDCDTFAVRAAMRSLEELFV